MTVPGVALVTGGGSGIGRAAALALQEAGHRVVVTGRRPEPLEETVSLGGGGPDMAAVPADVTSPGRVRGLFDEIRRIHGRLDVLFNNAGTGMSGVPIEEVDPEDWKRVVDVNLTGAFLCAQAAVRIMKDQTPRGGRIINNGSVSAHAPRPDMVAYTATKHAITGLTRSIALDGRRHGISCSQIDIGNAETRMTGLMKTGVTQASGEVAAEPVMDVRHCGEAVAFVAGLPPEANVLFMTIMATGMPLVGRG